MRSFDKPSGHRRLSEPSWNSLFIDIFVKRSGRLTSMEILLKLISSDCEVFEFTQVLDKDEEGKWNISRSFRGNDLSFNVFATLTLHFNAWRAAEFPSSDACMEHLSCWYMLRPKQSSFSCICDESRFNNCYSVVSIQDTWDLIVSPMQKSNIFLPL